MDTEDVIVPCKFKTLKILFLFHGCGKLNSYMNSGNGDDAELGKCTIIKHVRIIHDKDCAVWFCLWKQFFTICGIWVKENANPCVDEMPCLVITKDRTEHVPGNAAIFTPCPSYDGRNCSDMIHLLFDGFTDDNNMAFLSWFMETCFMPGSGMVGISWLYHDMAHAMGRDTWDMEITDVASMYAGMIREKCDADGWCWHSEYAMLYMEYIKYGVCRSFNRCRDMAESLLRHCGNMNTDDGPIPSLYLLLARISMHTPTENKYSIFYFRKLYALEREAWIPFTAGMVYMKAYGDENRALTAFRVAFRNDRNFYPALFNITKRRDMDGDWKQILESYGKVLSIISMTDSDDRISIREMEYEYKTCREIIATARKNMHDDELVSHYRGRIRAMRNDPVGHAGLDGLIGFLFHDDTHGRIRSEIAEELEKRMGDTGQ